MISLPECMSVFAVQITTDFLSGGRRGTTLEDRKNCCGRVTVALTRHGIGIVSVSHKILFSPQPATPELCVIRNSRNDMSVVEWTLDAPYLPNSRPPLAIAMRIHDRGMSDTNDIALCLPMSIGSICRREQLFISKRPCLISVILFRA